MLKTIQNDIRVAMDRDPAARHWLEILLCYSGVHALWGYRVAHWLWQINLKLLARWVSQVSRFFTGIEIHPAALIGKGLFIDHGMGLVIGETSEIGDNVTLFHGVTLGGVSSHKGKRHPTLQDGVVVGTGAKVLGAITIGECSRVGANAVVIKDVPRDSVVVGVPGKVVEKKEHREAESIDLNHNKMPDVVSEALSAMALRVEELESKISQIEMK